MWNISVNCDLGLKLRAACQWRVHGGKSNNAGICYRVNDFPPPAVCSTLEEVVLKESYRETAIMRYDANTAPDPVAWIELDEQERIDLAIAYHRRCRLPMGQDPKLHGMVHAIVENQVALGDVTVVPATLARLIREGLGRHDAVHAIGSVLIGIIFDVAMEKVGADVDINAQYGRELAELTAASWRAQAE